MLNSSMYKGKCINPKRKWVLVTTHYRNRNRCNWEIFSLVALETNPLRLNSHSRYRYYRSESVQLAINSLCSYHGDWQFFLPNIWYTAHSTYVQCVQDVMFSLRVIWKVKGEKNVVKLHFVEMCERIRLTNSCYRSKNFHFMYTPCDFVQNISLV